MGFRDYISVIGRRWHIFLLIVGIVISAHVFWVFLGQKQLHQASSMVIISPPIITANQLVLIRKSQSPMTRVETYRELSVLNIAVQLLTGERPFSSKEFDNPAKQEAVKFFTARFRSEAADGNTKNLLNDLRGSISVEIEEERVAKVTARSPSKQRALAYAWAVAEAARIFHEEWSREAIEKTVTELKKQLEQLEKERNVVVRDRTEFARRTGFTNFPRYQEMVQGIIFKIEGDISQLRSQQRELERTIDERISRSQQGREEIQELASEMEENPRLKELRKELLNARLEYDMATSRLTDRHPKVSSLQSKVEHLEGLIGEEEESIVANGLKRWNLETRELVKQSGALARKLEVLKERKASLSRELFRLAEISQDYTRIEDQLTSISKSIETMQSQVNELEWRGIQMWGQVQVRNLDSEAILLAKRGKGAGAIALTIIMALILALGAIYILEYIDTRVKTEEDVGRYLGLPLLEIIPNDRNRNLLLGENPRVDVAEKFNTAATLIRATARELGMKSFMVTSAVPKEGKTTVSVNLAVAMARKGVRVVLVDGDLRYPRIHELLGLPNKVGLTSLLDGQMDTRQVINGILTKTSQSDSSVGVADALTATDLDNLTVLTSGPPSYSPIQLIESDRMQWLLKELTEYADFVIFDTPPVNEIGDALAIAGLVDGTIYVVGAGLCDQSEVVWAKHLLTNVQANLLGVFLNRCSHRASARYPSYPYQASTDSRTRALARV